MNLDNPKVAEKSTSTKSKIVVDAVHFENAVLKRLIEEIKFDDQNTVNGYNRTHNRHNRGR